MKLKRARKIVDAYHLIEDADPGISTERLLRMVQDDTGADAGDVIEAFQIVEHSNREADSLAR